MYIELTTQGINIKVGLTDDDFYKMTSTTGEEITEDKRILNEVMRKRFENLGPMEREFFKILNFDSILENKDTARIDINCGIGMNDTLMNFANKMLLNIWNDYHLKKGDLKNENGNIGTEKKN